eukprot:gene2154-biopygen11320
MDGSACGNRRQAKAAAADRHELEPRAIMSVKKVYRCFKVVRAVGARTSTGKTMWQKTGLQDVENFMVVRTPRHRFKRYGAKFLLWQGVPSLLSHGENAVIHKYGI